MPSSALSDPFLEAAFWTGVTSLAVAVAMALLIAALRRRLKRQARAWRHFVHAWRPVLMGVILGDDGRQAVPALRTRDREDLLRLWIYLHESVRGDAHVRLRRFAHRLGLDVVVRQRLQTGSRAARLQAVLAAGLLRDEDAWEPLALFARGPDSPLAAIAARALVRIDAARACPLVLPLVLQRRDWSPAQAAAIVGEGGDAWHAPLVESLREVPQAYLPRILTWVAVLAVSLPEDLVRRWLLTGESALVLRAVLPLAVAPSLAPAIEPLLSHPDEDVRALAALRLADFGVTPVPMPLRPHGLEVPA